MHCVKVKLCLYRAHSTGIAELVLNLGIRWKGAVSFTGQLLYLGGKKLLYLLNRRLGVLRASLHIAEKTNSLAPARNLIQDRPAHTAI